MTTTPTLENPKFVHEDGYTGMIVDDSGTIAAREIHTDHETADGTKQRAFQSTVVEEEYRGQGLASKIIQHTVDRALDDGYRIVAICPVVKGWLEKQDDPRYKEAQDTARPEHFQ
jgi:hypothetical protein